MHNDKRAAGYSSYLLALVPFDQGWAPVLETAARQEGAVLDASPAATGISPEAESSGTIVNTDLAAVEAVGSTADIAGAGDPPAPPAEPAADASAPVSNDPQNSATVAASSDTGAASASAMAAPPPPTTDMAATPSDTTALSAAQIAPAATTDAGAGSAPSPAAIASPPSIVSFPGASLSTNGSFSPDCGLAVGYAHVVTVEQARIQWYDRIGNRQSDQSLFSFFNNPSTQAIGDARVVFDNVNGRFVVISDGWDARKIYVAVSRDSDPNHGWNYATIDAALTVNGQSVWADAPALATDGKAIYITGRMDSIGSDGRINTADDVFQETHLWIINAGAGTGGLYDGGPMRVADFGAAVVTGGASSSFGRPAQILSPTSGGLGTFIVNVTPSGRLQLVRIDNPTASPSFNFQTVVGAPSGSFPEQASQPLTTATLEVHTTGNAVWRDGSLYTIAVVGPTSGPDTGVGTAHWYKVDTANLNKLSLVDQGDVSGSALGAGGGVATFQPSITANANGDFMVNFSASGPGLYAGAYYALHAGGDPAGSLRAASPLHTGEDAFELRNAAGVVPWGDNSGIALDPVDGTTFWAFNQYAALRQPGQAGNWATQIGDVPAPQSLVDAAYYFAAYPDVAVSGLTASFHYNVYGWQAGRNPNAYFNTTAYLNANRDVRVAGVNPLTHYDQFGWRESRDPGLNFDNETYLAHAPDVKAAGMDPLLHYLLYGRYEGRVIGPAIASNRVTDDEFDPQYYLMANADVAAAGMDPRQHYLTWGWKEWRDPNAYFSTGGYLISQPDVNAAGVNPLLHYDQYGWKEARDPSAAFDTEYYLIHAPDVAATGVNPLEHYLKYGVGEARLVLPAVGPPKQMTATDFDPEFYRLAYPQATRSGIDPYTDFSNIGWHAGRNPNALFDVNYYLAHNPDVAAAGLDPLLHYAIYGWREGRDPSAGFSLSRYLAANPDVAAAGVDPLHHFLVSGLYEGRSV